MHQNLDLTGKTWVIALDGGKTPTLVMADGTMFTLGENPAVEVQFVNDTVLMDYVNNQDIEILQTAQDLSGENWGQFLTKELRASFSDLVWRPNENGPGGSVHLIVNGGAVPEPATWVLMVLAGICLITQRKRSNP